MDNHDAIAERIRGETFVTGAHEPFFLDDPALLHYVREGYLNVFVVEADNEDEALGRWPFLTCLREGAMVFGAPRELDRTVGYHGFLAVPSQNAKLVRGPRATIESVESFDLDTTNWIDDWVARLSEYMSRDRGPPPSGARLLEADPDVPYPAGSALCAQHLDTVWVTADRPMRFMGRDDLTVPPGAPPVALTELTWAAIDEDAKVSALYTPTVFLRQDIWRSMDAFNDLVRSFAEYAGIERSRALEERHRLALEHRHSSAAAMFDHLGGVLGAMEADKALAAGARTPLQGAALLVARAIDAPLEIPRNLSESGDRTDAVERMVRMSGIRTRGISLAPEWWKRAGPSFVGATRGAGDPMAVVARDNEYRVIDPQTGAAQPVSGKNADAIAGAGLMLYPPLPLEIDNGLAAMWHTLRRFGGDFRTILLMAGLGGLLALVTPIVTGRLLAEIIPRVDVSMWIAFLGALFGAAVGTASFDVVRALATLRIESRTDERLQSAVWSRLLALPTAFYRRFTVGDLADRANGISQIRQVITGVVAGAAISGVFSIFSFGLLFYYSWSLALCGGGLIVVLVVATAFFGRGQMRHHREAFALQGVIDGFVFQMITGIAKLRMANAETHALLRWAEKFSEQKRETLAVRRWAAAQMTFNSMFTPLSSLAILAFIVYILFNDEEALFGLADFLSFNAAFGQFVASMTGLAMAWTTAVAVVPLFERVQPILAERPETIAGGIDPGDLTGEIEFSNVSFRYMPESPNAVDGVSFHIRPGEFVAFVGPSGSGKSTVYRLILGFEQANSGSVFIDRHDLGSLDLAAVRNRMGVVLQGGQTTPASIFENIAGSSQLTMEEAWAAARAAGLANDIEEMPMGMHTVLPEGGVGLSGGQKQRLLIARALARKPRIILLDEATSALDNRTQAIVQSSLKSINATRVVIAHRLSTIQDAERIYVMDAGRIVEAGRYEELMSRDGAFARLARRQLV